MCIFKNSKTTYTCSHSVIRQVKKLACKTVPCPEELQQWENGRHSKELCPKCTESNRVRAAQKQQAQKKSSASKSKWDQETNFETSFEMSAEKNAQVSQKNEKGEKADDVGKWNGGEREIGERAKYDTMDIIWRGLVNEWSIASSSNLVIEWPYVLDMK